MSVLTGESWFTTHEFPRSTALLVQADKDKKYITKLELQSSGKYVVKFRGLTDEEKKQRKEQQKAARPKGRKHG